MLRLKELRIERELTQAQLATILGVNQTAVGKYERKELEPNLQNLIAMADFFECSVDYLIGRSDDFGNVNVQSPLNAALTKEEQKLLDVYRKLDMKGKIHVETYAELRLEEMKGSSSVRA